MKISPSLPLLAYLAFYAFALESSLEKESLHIDTQASLQKQEDSSEQEELRTSPNRSRSTSPLSTTSCSSSRNYDDSIWTTFDTPCKNDEKKEREEDQQESTNLLREISIEQTSEEENIQNVTEQAVPQEASQDVLKILTADERDKLESLLVKKLSAASSHEKEDDSDSEPHVYSEAEVEAKPEAKSDYDYTTDKEDNSNSEAKVDANIQAERVAAGFKFMENEFQKHIELHKFIEKESQRLAQAHQRYDYTTDKEDNSNSEPHVYSEEEIAHINKLWAARWRYLMNLFGF